jgi:hypothetical protein
MWMIATKTIGKKFLLKKEDDGLFVDVGKGL